MKQNIVIAPSILSADLARLGEDVTAVLNAGADWIHFDVMDNHYVPNLTFGPSICKALRNYGIKAHIDVHLMVEPVDRLIVDFAKAGASSISIHPEATNHLDRSIQLIKDNGCMAGVAFNPSTNLNHLDYIAKKLDFILLMTVNPGFGGQKFISSGFEKIKQARSFIDKLSLPIRLAVDGGVNLDNVADVIASGADTLIAGSAIFSTDDYKKTIDNFRSKIK